jgi:transcriptional regulator with XRE-family HTH domain
MNVGIYDQKKYVAHRLREMRTARGLSEGDIADRSGLARPYISRVENARTVPTIATLARWLDALEVSLSQFFSTWLPSPAPQLFRDRDRNRCLELARRLNNRDRTFWYRMGVNLLHKQ